jgi:hypothetical protein
VRLAWPKRPKIVCSPSYVDIRSRANTTMGLDYEHMIKARVLIVFYREDIISDCTLQEMQSSTRVEIPFDFSCDYILE